MTSRLWGSGSSLAHTETWEILPWYVNGSLEGDELEKIEQHLEDCEKCRQEVSYLRRLTQALARPEDVAPAVDTPLSEALSRIEQIEAERSSANLERFWDALRLKWPLRPLLVVQTLVILALVIALWQGSTGAPPVFHTLSRPTDAVTSKGFAVRMVFSPEVTEQELRRLLIELKGQIVEGPSPYGVYTVEIHSIADPEAEASLLEEIRAREEVEFLEPLLQQR